MQLSHVSGGMIQSGRKFVLKLEQEPVGGNAGPFGQQPSTEPAGANVGPFGQHPPSAKQVEQLAIKLNSTRMEEWPLLRLRRQRFNTQIAHIQHLWALGVMAMDKKRNQPTLKFGQIAGWCEGAQQDLVTWLRKGGTASLANHSAAPLSLTNGAGADALPLADVEPGGEQAQASGSDSSSGASSPSDKSSDDGDGPDSNAADPPGEPVAVQEAEAEEQEEVVEEDSRTREELVLECARLQTQNDKLEALNGALTHVNQRIVEDREDDRASLRRAEALVQSLRADIDALRVELNKIWCWC